MLKKIAICFLLLISSVYAEKFRTSFYIGQDYPDDGETRDKTASLVRFGIGTAPGIFRINSSFSYLNGSNFKQGELALGIHIYPLSSISKSRVQPYIFGEGIMGVGSLNEESRNDYGYDMGAGLDWRWGKSHGLTAQVAFHKAEETGHRLFIGWFWQ